MVAKRKPSRRADSTQIQKHDCLPADVELQLLPSSISVNAADDNGNTQLFVTFPAPP